MHAVVRRYRGASALNDLLAQRSQDVEQLLRDVPGFVAYYAIRAGDELATVTVCDRPGWDPGIEPPRRRVGEAKSYWRIAGSARDHRGRGLHPVQPLTSRAPLDSPGVEAYYPLGYPSLFSDASERRPPVALRLNTSQNGCEPSNQRV